jgi:general secretion pathway protein M
MIAQIRSWFASLSTREQWLVGIAGGLLGLTVLLYGIILPMHGAITASEKELEAATERRGRLQARAALAKAAPKTDANVTIVSNGATLGTVLADSASSEGFEMSDGTASGTDEYSFRLASAKAGPMLAWLTGLEAQGIELAEIKMQRGDGGYVSADVRVRKRR